MITKTITMGFGFNLFFMFVLMPLTILFILIWLLTERAEIGCTIGVIWIGIFGLAIVASIANWFSAKKELDKDDYYGAYVINRDYFKGKQTDWQYNHFRFEITDEDSIFFYETEKELILNTYRGTISTVTPYNSARLIINMEQPTHHILASNPTTYRFPWRFYMVFKSPKFHNVFFKKGKWKPLK